MSKPSFVYVSYLLTTAEKAWEGLLESELTRRYWYHDNVSDWRVGSPWEHRRSDGSGVVDVVGRVVESAPPHRLVLTWASPAEAADPAKHSKVTFELEPMDGMVRLTITHEDLEPGSKMLASISRGWPIVISGLKSLLETGRTVPKWW